MDDVVGQLCVSSPHIRRVLYLFAGVEREADISQATSLLLLAQDPELELAFENVDILRGGKDHDLLETALQERYLHSLSEGYYDGLITAAPCNNFSRALYYDDDGPPPTRDRTHLWGFPGLQGEQLKRVQVANSLIKFSIAALKTALLCRTTKVWVIGEFPEDLGDAGDKSPASLWQFQEMRELEDLGAIRGAIHQCEVAPVNYKKPTGLVTNIKALTQDPRFHIGWPILVKRNGRTVYEGPLPRQCSHDGHPGLIGRDKSGKYKTGPTATYHPEMCSWLAQFLAAALALVRGPLGQVATNIPADGVGSMPVELYVPCDMYPLEAKGLRNGVEALEKNIAKKAFSVPLGLHMVGVP